MAERVWPTRVVGIELAGSRKANLGFAIKQMCNQQHGIFAPSIGRLGIRQYFRSFSFEGGNESNFLAAGWERRLHGLRGFAPEPPYSKGTTYENHHKQ